MTRYTFIHSTFLIIIILALMNYIYASDITVDSENSFISAIKNRNYDNILIKNKIIINSIINPEASVLNIKGVSPDSSSIQFNYNITFSEGNTLKFHDINIVGNITINYSTVDFDNVNFYGNMTIFKNERSGGKLNIKNSVFTLYGEPQMSFLEISHYDTTLLKSEFYSFPSFNSTGSLVRFNGGESKKYNLLIQESKFFGEYINSAVDINSGKIKIYNTEFHRCSSYVRFKGGTMTVYNADILIKNCLFKDSYSDGDGGTFFISQTDSFLAEDVKVLNVTSRTSGSFIYVIATSDKDTHTKLKNIVHIGSGRVLVPDFGMTGVIASLNNYASLEIDNYYGEDFYSENSVGAVFSANGDPIIDV
eukprot:jgi/Orpsp1_1/1177667/evm.model.c7180000062372.1